MPAPIRARYRVSFEKIRRRLPQFKPQWDARKGAEQLYTAYQSSGLTLEEFEGPRYQRIGHIKKLMADGILDTDLRHTQRWNSRWRWPLRNRNAPDPERRAAQVGRPCGCCAVRPWIASSREDMASDMFALAAEIFPICRSITGNGVRQTLREIGAHIALEMHEVPTGNARLRLDDPARVEHSRCLYQERRGRARSSTFAHSNLHVMSYSVPVRAALSLG